MRKAKIQKLPIYTDIRAGEALWTPDGIQTAPLSARRFVFLDCQDRIGRHVGYEFFPLADYVKTEDARVYGVHYE